MRRPLSSHPLLVHSILHFPNCRSSRNAEVVEVANIGDNGTVDGAVNTGENVVKRDVFMSGESVPQAGTFAVINHSPTHQQSVELKKGEVLPNCPNCKQTVKYRFTAK